MNMKFKVALLLCILICGCKHDNSSETANSTNSLETNKSNIAVIDITRDTSENKDLESAEFDLIGTVFGVKSPRTECAKDSTYWVVSKKTYSRCLNMAKDFPDFFSNFSNESASEFSHKCVGLDNLPSEISKLYKNSFILQKQISPCSNNDSASLVKVFGKANIVRDPDEGSSCTVFDSVSVIDSSLDANKQISEQLGKRLKQISEIDSSKTLGESNFEFSPYTIGFVACACKPKSFIDSIGTKFDSRFSIFNVIHR
jgi:hypothetical protein